VSRIPKFEDASKSRAEDEIYDTAVTLLTSYLCINDHICFLLQMVKNFESPKLIWWIIIPPCIIYLFLMVHWPYAIPFRSLGSFGDLSYYIISNHRLLLLVILWSTFLAHVYEAFVARRICQQLNINQETTYLWIIQTFILGFPSLNILKGYTRRGLW
jgi:hypothetical protein